MNLNRITTLLEPVLYAPSPHQDDRPENTVIDMIVIHNISLPPGEFGTGAVEDFFCGKLDFSKHPYYSGIAELKVSAHLFIDRSRNAFFIKKRLAILAIMPRIQFGFS